MNSTNEIKELRKKLLSRYGKDVDKTIQERILKKHKKRIGFLKIGNVLKGKFENTLVLEEAILLLKEDQEKKAKLLDQIKEL